MKPTCRRYREEADFWRMRQFLRDIFVLNGRLERAWHVARLDYARWHGCMNFDNVRLEDTVFLWEAEGELVAIAMSEGGPHDAHFSVHPEWKTRELEEELLDIAEEHLSTAIKEGRRSLRVWAPGVDTLRQELLVEGGYVKSDYKEVQRYRDLDQPIPEVPVPAGYTIRPLGDGLELLERCYASGLGFHEGDIEVAVDNRSDPTWYRNIQTAPLYRRDLDLVAIAPDGSVASFCTIWFDDVTRSAYYEPVATVPEHRRLGLSRALLTEGLRRLQRMGATRAFVGGNSGAAIALYEAVMGPKHEVCESWVREW